MATKKPNTLAALRMMVESDEDDEEESSEQNGLSNEEILRIQFESTQPQQPLKSILKRKMPKEDVAKTEDFNSSDRTQKESSPTELKQIQSIPKQSTIDQQDPPSPKKGLAAQGLAQALMFIKDNEEDVTKDEKEVEKLRTMVVQQEQKEETAIIKVESENMSQNESNDLLTTQVGADLNTEEETDVTPPVISVQEKLQTDGKKQIGAHVKKETTAEKKESPAVKQKISSIKEDLKTSNKKLETDNKANKDVKPPAKKIIMKLSGLPPQFSKRELMIFLGVWPMNGNDGIRCITDRYGEPTGCAYLELDRHQDKMDVLRMSGMTYNDKVLKAVLSSTSEMDCDWALTQQAIKQLEKSTFVRLSRLKTTASKEDLTNALSRFHLKTEDIYCLSSSDDCISDGTVFVVTDSFKVANALCSAKLLSNGRSLEARRVHPDFVSHWCSKNDISFSVREFGDVEITDLEGPEQLEPDINAPDENRSNDDLKVKEDKEVGDEPQKTIDAKISDENVKPSFSAKPVLVTDQPPKLTSPENKPIPATNMPPRPVAPFTIGPQHMGPMPMRPPFMPGPPMMIGGRMMGVMRPPGIMPMVPLGRPMGPPGPRPMGPPGMGPMGPQPGFMPTIYMRMYNLPEQANAEDIKQFFAPIVPAKIAQNTGYNIFDVDFYTPADTMMALKRQGMLIRKNPISMEMLPGPPVPLPPRLNVLTNRKRTHAASPPRGPRHPPPPKRRDYSPPRRPLSPPRREPVPRRDRSPPRRERSPGRRGRTPPRRGYSPSRRGHSPPSRRYSPQRRGRTPPRRSPDHQRKRNHGKTRWEKVRPETPPSTKRREPSPVPQRSVETIKVDPFPENPFDYRLAPFDVDKPAGQCAIQVMEGYFCQLCRKFYNSKSAGKITHCKSKAHYDKLKEHLEELKRKKMSQDGR